MIIFIYKSWSVNFLYAQKSREGILFLFKVFNKYIVDLKKNSEIFNSFLRIKVYYGHNWLY